MSDSDQTAALQAKVAELEAKVVAYEQDAARLEHHLALFDRMDFELFSKADWPGFRESHTADTHVTMPDGTTIDGIEPHTGDMQAMFEYLPDLHVEDHPVKVAQGQWTAVIGRFTGTFTQPMPLPGGGSIPPTGNTVRMSMATFARWENDQIAEEVLFWDSAEFMKQLGLAQ